VRIRVAEPLTVVMDGKSQRGLILKPGTRLHQTDEESGGE
jgi:hypothetical protein